MKLRSGQILIISIIFLAVVLILSAALFSSVAGFLRFGSNSILKEQATQLAEAGVDYAIWQLNKTAGSYTPPASPFSNIGTFEVTVIDKTSSLKTITSTGYIPNVTSPRAKRTIRVDALISSESISFRYAVLAGDDGIQMANSSEISGTAYSNANIQGSGPSTIDGDAYAFGNIDSPPFVTGNSYPNSPKSEMPIKNPSTFYQYWRDAANINEDPITCTPTCSITNSTEIGPQKYVGDLEISSSGTRVTMNGPVYVTGNFTIRNQAELKLNDTFGSTGTILIVDGTVTVRNNGYLKPTTANPKGYILVVTPSTASPAITISNMGASAVFYAQDGEIQLANQAQVSALVAKKLNLGQSAKLIYDSGLASAQFSAIGPGGSWQIKKGTYKFISSP